MKNNFDVTLADKMLAEFRSSVHLIEKGAFLDVEAEKRKEKARDQMKQLTRLLSEEEINWAEKVLNNKVVEKYQYRGLIDHTDLMNNIARRRSVREFSGPVSKNVFVEMVEAANYAPSSCNRQPIEYLLTYEVSKIISLGKIKKQKFIETAPSVILALCNVNMYFKQNTSMAYFMFMDSGVSIQNLILAGYYNNIGTCIVNVSLQDSDKIKRLFNIPDCIRVSALIPCGEILEDPEIPGRKNLKSMIHYEEYKI